MGNDGNATRDGKIHDRGFGHEHSSRGNEREAAGTPGKRAATDGMRAPGDDSRRRTALALARAAVARARGEDLPRLREAISSRSMRDARRAAGDLERSLGSAGRELDEAEQLGADVEALRVELEAVRTEAAPDLALAPPPAPPLPETPWALAYAPPSDEDIDAERAKAAAWNERLDAHDAARDEVPPNLIDASDRFGARRLGASVEASDTSRVESVQRRALDQGKRARTDAFRADVPSIQEVAAHGVAGRGTTLPYLDPIQASFGRHDVSQVQAYVGGEAADAAETIGAEAYAAGDRVAFAGPPSLHTAAHEAAHTVQQRGGVQLRGGVGAAGDTYEKHADAVADAVVRGESAEALLDERAGGGTAAATTAVQRQDARDARTPLPSFTFEVSERPFDRVSIDGQINWSVSDPAYQTDTPVGDIKGGSPSVKLQKRRGQITTDLSTALGKIKHWDAEVIDGLTFSFETELANIEMSFGKEAAYGDESATGRKSRGGREPGWRAPEITALGLVVKVEGDLNPFLATIGVDPEPYRATAALRVKVRLDPADAVHAARALGKLRELRRIEKQAEEASEVARNLEIARTGIEAKIAKARRSGSVGKVAKFRRQLSRIAGKQKAIGQSMKRLLDLAKGAQQAVAEVAGKMTSKAGQLWGEFLTTAVGKVVGGILATLSLVLVLVDIYDIAVATYHLARRAARPRLGGGGTVGSPGGEHVGSTGHDPGGTSEAPSETGASGGDGPAGAEAGTGAEVDAGGDEGWQSMPGELVDDDVEGDGEGGGAQGGDVDGSGDDVMEAGGLPAATRDEVGPSGDVEGKVSAPGHDPDALGDETGATEVDAADAARGDGEPDDRVLLTDNPAAKRILAALEAQGLDVSDDVLGYVEVLVPDDWTEAQTDALIAKLAAWLPAQEGDAFDDQQLITLVIEEVARMMETEPATPAADQAKGKSGGDASKGKGDAGATQRGHAGGKRPRRRGKGRGRGRHGGRSGAARGRAANEPQIVDGKLELPSDLVEKWIQVDDGGALTNSKAAKRWIATNNFTTKVDGKTYRAKDLDVTGHRTADGEYEGTIMLTMQDSKTKQERLFTFSFRYAPGAEKGRRFTQDATISIEPLERAASLSPDGRPIFDTTAPIDLGPFQVLITRTAALSPEPDAEERYDLIVWMIIATITDPSFKSWRGQPITEGAEIQVELRLRLLGPEPPL